MSLLFLVVCLLFVGIVYSKEFELKVIVRDEANRDSISWTLETPSGKILRGGSTSVDASQEETDTSRADTPLFGNTYDHMFLLTDQLTSDSD